METKLQKVLKQNKPFKSLEEEFILNLVRTAEFVSADNSKVFKNVDLMGTQYNSLRVLRGAGANGLSCSEISERMVTKGLDIPRLLDRIESRGFISRERSANNPRMVIARIRTKDYGFSPSLTNRLMNRITALPDILEKENQKLLTNCSQQLAA